MNNEEIERLGDRMIELWNAHDAEASRTSTQMGRPCATRPNADNVATGRDAIVARTRMILDGFSDAKLELLDQAHRRRPSPTEWRFTGTHDGEFLGVPATGQPTETLGASVTQVDADGKIASETAYWDLASFLRQTGVLPAGAESAVPRGRPT